MTTVAVLCDPPRPGRVLPDLVASTPLSTDEAAGLYAALTKDTVRAVADSGGDLIVNSRPVEALDDAGHGPAGEEGTYGEQTDNDAEAELRAVVADVID
ncbi:hypothetical protein BRD11_06465, partial [Halobacteriales archaeon SW_12_69_24]